MRDGTRVDRVAPGVDWLSRHRRDHAAHDLDRRLRLPPHLRRSLHRDRGTDRRITAVCAMERASIEWRLAWIGYLAIAAIMPHTIWIEDFGFLRIFADLFIVTAVLIAASPPYARWNARRSSGAWRGLAISPSPRSCRTRSGSKTSASSASSPISSS